MIRTVKVWINYDPTTRTVIEYAQFKYLLHQFEGCIIFPLKGMYAAVQSAQRSRKKRRKA